MLASDIEAGVSALAAEPERATRAVLRPYRGCGSQGDAGVNQFLLLLKPHMLDVVAGVDVAHAVALVLATLAGWSVEIGGVVALRHLHRKARIGPEDLRNPQPCGSAAIAPDVRD